MIIFIYLKFIIIQKSFAKDTRTRTAFSLKKNKTKKQWKNLPKNTIK